MLDIPVGLAAVCGVGSPLVVLATFVVSISQHPWFIGADAGSLVSL